MANIIEVKCPKCNEILVIDVDAKEVIEHKEIPKAKVSLEDFIESQKNRASELDQKFKQGIEKTKNKSKNIDEDFEDFLKNKDKLDLDEPPTKGIIWD